MPFFCDVFASVSENTPFPALSYFAQALHLTLMNISLSNVLRERDVPLFEI